MITSDGAWTIPIELTVVGEDRNDPQRLLMLGDDGRYYAYSLVDGEAEPVEPDQQWQPVAVPGEESIQA